MFFLIKRIITFVWKITHINYVLIIISNTYRIWNSPNNPFLQSMRTDVKNIKKEAEQQPKQADCIITEAQIYVLNDEKAKAFTINYKVLRFYI